MVVNHNKMVINADKTKSMLITTRQKRQSLVTEELNIQINGTTIENTDSETPISTFVYFSQLREYTIYRYMSFILCKKKIILFFSCQLLCSYSLIIIIIVISRKLDNHRTNRVLNTGTVVCESITLSGRIQLILR